MYLLNSLGIYILLELIDYLKSTCSKGEVHKNQMIKDISSATVARELSVGGYVEKF